MTDPIGTFDEVHVLKNGGYFGVLPPVMSVIRGSNATASINFITPFFIADRACEVTAFRERHAVAATDGSLQLVKIPSGTASASGTNLLSSALVLTAVADTNQEASLTNTLSARRLAKGDALALTATGLLTSLSNVATATIIKAI